MERGCYLFKREHHQKVQQLLQSLNAEFLLAAQCYFGGGTAPVLLLGEYRESVDVDFLCASQDGYRLLREQLMSDSLGKILKYPLDLLREVRADQYGIRTFIQIDGVPIKFEIIREARIALEGKLDKKLGVPVLSRIDLMVEKLLANADRGDDKATYGRDMIDLAMMAQHWGGIPEAAWHKANTAYGGSVKRSFDRVLGRLLNDSNPRQAWQMLKIEDETVGKLTEALKALAAC